MQSSVASIPLNATVADKPAAQSFALPWYCYVVAFAAACIPIGALWDISWHSTIGRDSFWTPAHMLIYLGGALPGFCCGWIVFRTSFLATDAERENAVRYFGFHGPLGAWVTIWGSLTMIVSAPFDNWWHDAYGLDVEILSPPHTLLALGMYAVAIGATLLVLARQNQDADAPLAHDRSKSAQRLFLFTMGVLIAMASIILTEKSYPNAQHTISFYVLCSITYAGYLTIASRASRSCWGATIAAAWYMLIVGGMVWLLPRFKAQPMLAPIYLQVDHMVPPVFPFILLAPALAMDWINLRLKIADGFWRRWVLAIAMGSAFLAMFLVVQWNFSGFLLHSAHAKNWFFAAGQQWPYFARPGEWRGRFWTGRDNSEILTLNWTLIILAITVAVSRFGIFIGGWMQKVRR